MKQLLTCLAAVGWIGFRCQAGQQDFQEDFSRYAAGTDGSPAWEIQDAGWTAEAGAYEGTAGWSIWRAVPHASALAFACDLTVLELERGDWLTAGIGVFADEKNYWAVNFTVAPEDQKRRRGLEMHEMLEGTWLAQGQAPHRLEALPSRGQGFNWETGQTYRVEMTLTISNITGRVLRGSEEVASFGYRFKSGVKAVASGWPGLRLSGLRARFDNATARVLQAAPEPTADKPVYPPWVSREGRPLGAATGFFRTVETGGRWWLLDPEGKPFFDIGTDHVSYRGHWCEKLGYAPYHRNMQAKYGSEEAWGRSTLQRLREWGFNTLPAGHSPSLRHQGLPHILFASFGAGFAGREYICEPIHWTGFPDVFSPRWEPYCRLLARRMARESLNDPWCLGTFLDNELEWYGKQGHLVDEVFRGNPKQSAKRALYQWLIHTWDNLETINRQLATRYAGEADFLATTNLPPASPALNRVRQEFLALIAERYFRGAAEAMRAADPQHLVLGCRFAGRTPEPVLAAAGQYNDVFTFNTYPRIDFEDAWLPDGTGAAVEDAIRQIGDYYSMARKPVLITEWSFPALDSGLPCRHGAGMRVDTQAQKAACYRIFANAVADLPFVVGYHYFMWADEPALGISSTFPEDSNYGLVNEQDVPYAAFVPTVTEVNQAAAARHARSRPSGRLELQVEPGALVIRNTDSIPSHGRLRLSTNPPDKVEEVALPPDQSRRIPMPAKSFWSAELQHWDTTRTRVMAGAAGSPSIVNIGPIPVTRVPVVADGPAVTVCLVRQLAPGAAMPLPAASPKLTPTERLECASATTRWSCGRQGGRLFDSIRAGDFVLGSLAFAVHQQVDGRDHWVEPETITQLEAQEQPDGWVVEAVVQRAAANGGPAGYRARVRAAVFKELDLAMVRPLWIENLDARRWRLMEAFWFCRSAIGGSPDNDIVGGPNVPNYYRHAQYITDSSLGGCFGSFNQSPGWQVLFWADPRDGIHPDARFAVGQDLAKGERWTAGAMPYLWVYASKDARAWEALSATCSQAARGLVVTGLAR